MEGASGEDMGLELSMGKLAGVKAFKPGKSKVISLGLDADIQSPLACKVLWILMCFLLLCTLPPADNLLSVQ